MSRSSSNMMPRGQYKVMIDQKKEGLQIRSNSVQGLPRHRQWHSTGKQQFRDDGQNYGELLYERGMRKKEEKRNLV